MKIISFKNPLPKEVTDKFDSYCNKEVECSCGTTFKADVSDIYIGRVTRGETLFRILVNCPICNEQHCIGSYNFCEDDINNFNIYKNYLKNKIKFEKLKGEN